MFTISSLPSLQGKTFLVTGGNTGIGYTTCLNLAAKGAKVFMGARSSSKASSAIASIKELHPKADIRTLIMDNNSLTTIVEAAKQFSAQESMLHGLILNAGIMAVPYEVTPDGFENQMQINYLAHWLLTYHLLPVLLSTARQEGPGSVRVVSVSSDGHQKFSFGVTKILYEASEVKACGGFKRYGLSKFANVLHANSLHSQYGPGSESSSHGKGEIWTASLHPGFIDTQLNEKTRDNTSWKLSWIHRVLKMFGVMRPWDEGCVSSLFVGASPEFTAAMSGKYFNEKAVLKEPNPGSNEVEEQIRLEKWTREAMQNGGWI
ncbi:putative oxidoreductase [Lachnellula occidentalis]|uniref:Putative oxidoreductase n=1 Tax=Lachnellula occidentalis TaxID=215460 RepID=A0A8H8RPB8_9HELO|nr:putative oxidoreductase [Lachnellula occidentalis]